MLRASICENIKCQKDMINTLYCNRCFKKLCSATCVKNHIQDSHQKPPYAEEKAQVYYNYESEHNTKSSFIKEGSLLIEHIEDSNYDFSNFELKRSQNLGNGAFGEVIVGLNKKDGKKYAIKQVQ